MSIRQPLGIAGIITPWNFPMAIPCWKMMPALVAGNTVVFKPARDTPQCATLARRAHGRGGLPGRASSTSSPARAPRSATRSSTARTSASSRSPAARRRARRSRERAGAPAQARLSLELGGKNAVVVLARRRPRPRDRRHPVVRVRHDRPAVHGLLARDRRPGRSPTTLVERLETRRADAPARVRARRDGRRRAAHQRRPRSTRSERYVDIGRREGELVIGGAPGDGRRPRARPLLRADDLRRRRADGADRARRRSSGRCCRSSRSTATTRR